MEKPQYRVPSLSQLHQQLVTSKQQLKEVLDAVDFTPLETSAPFYSSVCGRNSIESVLDTIPSEEALKGMIEHATRAQKQDSIMHYTGQYKLVRELQAHLGDARKEALDTFYLLTQLKPVHLGSAEQYIKENSQLHSWKIHTQEEKPTRDDRNALHYKYREELKHKEKRADLVPQRLLLRENDLVVHVLLYDSHLREKQNEFMCHGKQLLSHLKDSFYCLIEEVEGRKDGGSFICIDNIFYNDTRFGKEDLSKDIREKAAQKKQDNFIALSMEKTRLEDLRIEVGQPYVFRHLQGCDHMLIFNQVRLFDPTMDLRDSREYPVNIYEKKLRRKRCDACQKKFATLIVLDDRMKNGEHGYYCDRCYKDLNETEEGAHKVKGLMVIKYFHD